MKYSSRLGEKGLDQETVCAIDFTHDRELRQARPADCAAQRKAKSEAKQVLTGRLRVSGDSAMQRLQRMEQERNRLRCGTMILQIYKAWVGGVNGWSLLGTTEKSFLLIESPRGSIYRSPSLSVIITD
jgi:hypothetical protein